VISVDTKKELVGAYSLSAERIEQHLASGRVRVDGERVTDPDHPAPKPAVISLARSEQPRPVDFTLGPPSTPLMAASSVHRTGSRR
jgi:hypothetical protein